MSSVFPRHTNYALPVISSGDGVHLIDIDGRRYIDACGGAAVSCLGHSNKRVSDAIKSQVDKLSYAHTSFFTSEPAEALADKLVALAPDGIEHVYLVSGGSEAVEAAIKLSRQYFLEINQPERQHIVSRRQSYHGNTLGALAAGGNEWRRSQFKPLLADAMHHIDACHYWRFAQEGESEYAYGQRLANQLEQKILELGETSVAAFLVEPVVGATLGAVPAVEGYFTRIREICDQYGVLLILDEVMCGMGRTGSMFASEQEGINPDIVCIAKGLGAGFQPIGAMLCSATIYTAIAQGSGFFQHGHTYLGHPVAAAAALAVIDELQESALVEQVARRGRQFMSMLNSRLGNHPNVGHVRGRGLFVGVELVEDKQTKQPLDPSLKIHAKLKRIAFENGLMIYPMGGTVDGRLGDHVLLAPPFIASVTELGDIVELLDKSLHAVLPAGAR
ncbi:UNVERIFIED_CONTAM: hypothetical protein GTU68_037059 [Idotea baltica]|nr:hypothetical protein [Idotea baltica]